MSVLPSEIWTTLYELGEFLNPKTGRWDRVSISKRVDKILAFAMEHWNHHNV